MALYARFTVPGFASATHGLLVLCLWLAASVAWAQPDTTVGPRPASAQSELVPIPPAATPTPRQDTQRRPLNQQRRLPAFDATTRPTRPQQARTRIAPPPVNSQPTLPTPTGTTATAPATAAGKPLAPPADSTIARGDTLARMMPRPARTEPLPAPPLEAFVTEGAWHGWQPLVSLNQPWVRAQGDSVRVPFSYRGFQRQLDLSTRFFLADSTPRPSTTLLFEYVPGEVALYWDNALLGVYQTGRQPLRIPLAAAQLQRGWHSLRVVQRPGHRDFQAGALRPVLGIPQPVYLVVPGSGMPARLLPAATSPKAIQYLLPDSAGGIADPQRFLNDLQRLRQQTVRALMFPHDPPAVYLALMRREGFSWVQQADSLACLQCDAAQQTGATIPCWTTNEGTPTEDWGTFADAARLQVRALQQVDALLLMLPGLLILLGWKLADGTAYRTLLRPGNIAGERKRYEQARGQQLLRGGALLLASLGQAMLLATSLTFVLLFLRYHEVLLPQADTPWGYPALTIMGMLPPQPLLLFVVLLGVVATHALLRYSVGSILAGFYRRRYFLPRLLGLEAYATFPWILLPLLAGFVFVALPAGDSPAAGMVMALAWAGFYAIRTLRVARGLDAVLDFHWVAIMLYICAVEILPYLIGALLIV